MIITHPEKIMFPDEGITKGELASYYEAIAPVMLPHLLRRPITMERFHRGIAAPGFFQKDVSKGFPEWLERVEVPKHGGTVNHPIVTDKEGLPYAMVTAQLSPRPTQCAPGPARPCRLHVRGKKWKAVKLDQGVSHCGRWPNEFRKSAICGPACCGASDR